MTRNIIELNLQHQTLDKTNGFSTWKTIKTKTNWKPSKTALLLCDIWDSHWCRGAVKRLNLMTKQMNNVTSSCRSLDMPIIHAPSSTLDFYKDTPARKRVKSIPPFDIPPDLDHSDPPLPVDSSDHGSDTGEEEPQSVWTRQHSDIFIDHDRDLISDDGKEIYNCLQHFDIKHVLIMGVHTKMCILHRSFGIKQMVRWGIPIALIRDLTDTMYNPEMPPYVNHNEGTELVISFIEKFWCPTIHSSDILT